MSADDFWKYYSLSTVVCGTYFAGSDTILVLKLFCDVFGEGTRLAMPKAILRAELIVIEAWFRGLMTHKYRGCIIVLSISKSVEPNKEQKEMISGFQQGILCKY